MAKLLDYVFTISEFLTSGSKMVDANIKSLAADDMHISKFAKYKI